MAKRALFGLAAAAAFMAPGMAHADASFGAQAGTGGLGVEGRYAFNEMFALRGSVSTLEWDVDETYDGVSYNGQLEYTPAGVYLDYHPFANGFFVTGGAMIGAPGIDLTATPAASVQIGGATYTPADVGTLEVNSDIGDSAPFIGVGWTSANSKSQGMYFSALAGAAFYGDATVSMRARDGLLAADPTFLADLQDEADALRDDLNDFKTYPIVQLSTGYRF
ncbi:MAG: hypothetical protein JNJ73_17355 [Hyphomonadaceae bacterium]|nr:hypothetical protein [Hyphomonadaceae bacterium]